MPSSPSAERLRIAFVVPRFGDEVVGGAELHASWLARRLAASGHAVEIVTTCALDHHTWRNELPPGESRSGDLTVRRFPADERDLGIHGELERAITQGLQLSRDEQLLWLRHGVSSRAMEEYLAGSGDRYDIVVAMPYLFGTTYFAWAARPEKTVLVPCLHDEAYARLGVVAEMLSGARGLMFNAPAERGLAETLADDLAPSTVVGVGFDPPADADPERFRTRYKVDRPFLLYVGRREGGKNTPLLIDHFVRYQHRRGSELQLVLVGSGDAVPKHPDVREVDLDWADRDAMYAAADLFCQPSTNESLSIVVMQAWLARCPVIVHRDCAVTKEHCVRSNGGLWFATYAEFEAVVDRLMAEPALRQTLGEQGRGYVLDEYGWDTVLSRFEEAARSWTTVPTGT